MRFHQIFYFFLTVVFFQNVCFAMHRNKSDIIKGNLSNQDYAATIGVTQQSHKVIIKYRTCILKYLTLISF